MAGQVKHRQIFSDIVPDLKLMGVLARLAVKNTDSLIGGVADALGREGITLLLLDRAPGRPDGASRGPTPAASRRGTRRATSSTARRSRGR